MDGGFFFFFFFQTGRILCSSRTVVSHCLSSCIVTNVFFSLPEARLDFDVFLHAQLGQRLFDAQGGEARRPVGVPTLAHDLSHHAQRLAERRETTTDHHQTPVPRANRAVWFMAWGHTHHSEYGTARRVHVKH